MEEKTKKASASKIRSILKKLREKYGWSASGLIGLLRGGGSSSKGSGYERDMCRQLSLWWTNGTRDDIFWRSSGSGARAKVRSRQGRDTAGQHGDIAATDPIGVPLIDVFTIEIKRGYSEHTAYDLFDRQVKGGVQAWERFIQQAMESHAAAGSYTWLLITRRDRRRAMVWFPAHLFSDLRETGAFLKCPVPFVRMKTPIRSMDVGIETIDMCGTTLDAFMEMVKPDHIKILQRKV